MDKPTLTVGMPVFNGARYLEAALASILGQTFVDFELIISDNGSTDRTEDICRSYALADSRIRYLRSAVNQGASKNYNLLVDLARGRYFKWAAHDDLCAPTCFERCVSAYASASQDTVLVYPRTLLIDENADVIQPYADHLDLQDPDPSVRVRKLAERLHLCNAVFGLVPTHVLRRTRLIAPFASSDEVLLVELALLGRFREVPEPLFMRRIHDERSIVTHRAPAARTAWFDPAVGGRLHLPRTKVFTEDLKSIARSPLALREGTLAAIGLLRGYLPRWWKSMAGEIRRAVIPSARHHEQ